MEKRGRWKKASGDESWAAYSNPWQMGAMRTDNGTICERSVAQTVQVRSS